MKAGGPAAAKQAIMDKHYTYLLVDTLTIFFPFVLSFDKKVSFYKSWKYWWPAMLVTGAFFIVWDICFTLWGIWSFSATYTLPPRIGGLPVEEWLFFIVVPYSCVFIYECLKAYFPRIITGKDIGWVVLMPLGGALVLLGIYWFGKAYTASSFTFCGLFIMILYLLRNRLGQFRADVFMLTFIISFIPFLIVNGVLTTMPVVLYNNTENLGIRMYTIPVEDTFYGMLLMLGNVTGMEWLKAKQAIKRG